MMVEASCYAILALGLTIQWGYAGLFNVGVMGFIAAGVAASMLISYPVNQDFWNSAGPGMVGLFLLKIVASALLLWFANRSNRFGAGPKLRALLIAVAVAIAYYGAVDAHGVDGREIEQTSGWIGGLGLPVILGWIVGGGVAGVIAWFVGKICLGLRADYLASRRSASPRSSSTSSRTPTG